MSDYVADTHALFWYLSNSKKLGKRASAAFDEADQGNAYIYVPSIAIAELFYLNVKLRRPIDFVQKYKDLEQNSQFILTPLEPADILDFDKDSSVTEMHDRIIVGVARRLNVGILTIDKNIVVSGLVKTIW